MTRTDFEDDLGRRLRSLADQISVEPAPLPARSDVSTHSAPRSRAFALAGAAAFVLVIAAVAVLALRGPAADDDARTTPAPTPTPAGKWTPLPGRPEPDTLNPSAVWTGSALIVWGGETSPDGTAMDSGAAFDPATSTWTTLPPGPLEPTSGHVAVWTGTEMIVCCGQATSGAPAAAAFTPTTGSWRPLPAPPVDLTYAGAVWTGTEMLVVGGASTSAAAAFDPTTETWRRLADSPDLIERDPDVAWTGTQLVVWPRSVFTEATGMTYDPSTDTWASLPALPDGLRIAGASMVWTGEEIVIWGPEDEGDSLIGARLKPGEATWRPIAATPLPSFRPYDGTQGATSTVWTGTRMLAVAGSVGSPLDPQITPTLAYDPIGDAWQSVADTSPAGELISSEDLTFSIGLAIEQLTMPSSTESPPTTVVDSDAERSATSGGLELLVPSGWHSTTDRLYGATLDEPDRSVTVATFALDELPTNRNCAEPVAALNQLGPTDAIVSIRYASIGQSWAYGPHTTEDLLPQAPEPGILRGCLDRPVDFNWTTASVEIDGQAVQIRTAAGRAVSPQASADLTRVVADLVDRYQLD